ncbi:MAG: hypothetical protein WD940_01295 [Patescibacteria group bacterium]
MKKLIALLVAFPILIVAFFIFLVRSDRLPNPFEELEPDNALLSRVTGTINDLLGTVHEEDEEKSLEEQFAESGYPAELFSFDVTAQPAVFAVISVDPDRKTMLLRYVFPFNRRDNDINSEIKCAINDPVITTIDSSTGEATTVKASSPLYEIVEAGKDTLQGVCGDQDCKSIVKSCELVRTK